MCTSVHAAGFVASSQEGSNGDNNNNNCNHKPFIISGNMASCRHVLFYVDSQQLQMCLGAYHANPLGFIHYYEKACSVASVADRIP